MVVNLKHASGRRYKRNVNLRYTETELAENRRGEQK